MGSYNSDKKNAKFFGIKLSRNTDADIIKWLESQESVQGYLKSLIRADMTKEGKNMKRWYIFDCNDNGTEATPISAKSEEDAARIMRETWSALSKHDQKLRDDYLVALCDQDEDGEPDFDTAEKDHSIKDADQIMLAHYRDLIAEMTSCYRNVLESDGAIQYKIYIWEDGEIETLEGPQGDSSSLVARSNDYRNLYHVTTISAPCVDVFDLAGSERPEDPDEEETAKAEAIDWLVDNYSEEAEARLDAAIDDAQE